jgi:hypothetical protein
MNRKKILKRKSVSKKEKSVSKTPVKKIKKEIPVKEIISHRAEHIARSDTEKILIENFVSLQKVMVNLSVKFDGLNQQISRLLDLFEISAKALTEKRVDMGIGNKEVIEKIDKISEQNKLIARGLSIMHENRGGQNFPSLSLQKEQTPQVPKFLPTSSQQESVFKQNQNAGDIQNSSPPKFKLLPKE